MKPIIEIKNLNISIDGKKILKDINLGINEQESLAILGPGGSGKSTLLHTLRGINDFELTSGEITYHLSKCGCGNIAAPSKEGTPCRDCGKTMEPFALRYPADVETKNWHNFTEKIALMLQRSFGVFIFITALENVMDSLRKVGCPDAKRIERATKLLEEVGLSHRAMETGLHLSGGEKQRLVLARQLAKYPILMLADDPTSTLDSGMSEVVLEAIKNVKEKYRMTTIFSTQSPQLVGNLADRALVLKNGEIVFDGSPAEALSSYIRPLAKARKRNEAEVGEPLIQVRDVKKYFYSLRKGIVKAVDGVSLDIYRGEIFGVVGASGSGKTTLVRLIAGMGSPAAYTDLYAPGGRASLNYEGSVHIRYEDEWIDMKVVGPERGQVTAKIGMLHQEYVLSQEGNMLYNLTGSEEPDKKYIERAINSLELVGFDRNYAEEILQKTMYMMSEDEKHRCAMARILVKDPEIIMLDEPSESMDMIAKAHVIDTIHNIREETGKTFIVVSHDIDFVRHVCDRVARMDTGKVSKVGSPDKVLE